MTFGITLHFQKTHPRAKPPCLAHPDDAGFDLFPCDPGSIHPGDIGAIELGFKAAVRASCYAQFMSRSSLAKQKIYVVGGTIDPGYRGDWIVMVHNQSGKIFNYSPDKAVAQVIFYPVFRPEIIEVEELPPSSRGAGGFGSTDQ